MTIAFSGAICAISARTSCFWLGSRPSVGSSSTSTGGSCSSACASPTRRLKPFDRVSTGCSSTPAKPGQAHRVLDSLAPVRGRRSRAPWRRRAGSRRRSFRDRSARPRAGSPARGAPPRRRSARRGRRCGRCRRSGIMKPASIRMVVDLPAPLGPRKPSTSPRATLNDDVRRPR